MNLPERMRAGFALAATIAGDPGAKRAGTGLSPALHAELAALAQQLAAMSKAERRAKVRDLAAMAPRSRIDGLVPAAHQAGRPVRALALLAGFAEREDGARWLAAGSSLPRPGFAPEPSLLQRLRLLTSRPAQP